MSTTKKGSPRRLKQKNSASTEEGSESTILINVKSPKQEKYLQGTKDSRTIIQVNNNALPAPSSPRSIHHLMPVPLLKKKKEETNLFDTKYIDGLLNSDLGVTKSPELSYCLPGNIEDFNLSNILSVSGGQNERIRESGRQTTRNEHKDKYVQQTPVFNRREKPEAQFPISSDTNGKDYLKKCLSQNENKPHEQSKVEIALDEEEDEVHDLQHHQNHHFMKAKTERSTLRGLKSLELKKPSILKENATSQANRNQKSVRMTLRDYMYQTQVSSKKAFNSLKEIEEEKQIQNSPRIPKGHKIQKRYSLTSTQYKSARFGISQKEMYDILRQEISSDIQQIIGTLKDIEKEMAVSQKNGGDRTKQQLLQLYNVRRSIKEAVTLQVKQIYKTLLQGKRTYDAENEELIFGPI